LLVVVKDNKLLLAATSQKKDGTSEDAWDDEFSDDEPGHDDDYEDANFVFAFIVVTSVGILSSSYLTVQAESKRCIWFQ
jgi:hypothetical protein